MTVICWFLQSRLCIQWIPWSKDMTKHHQRDPVTATRARAWRKWPISRSQWPQYALRGPHDRCMLIRKHTKFCTRCTKHAKLVREQYILCTYALRIRDARYITNWGLFMDGIITEFDSFISSCLYIYIDRAICIVELLQNEENSSEIYMYSKWSKSSLKEKDFYMKSWVFLWAFLFFPVVTA